MKVKTFKQTPWFPRFVSFGKYLNLTISFFGHLETQSLQRSNNSKQQFVLTNFVEFPIISSLNKSLKDYLQVFEMLLLR